MKNIAILSLIFPCVTCLGVVLFRDERQMRGGRGGRGGGRGGHHGGHHGGGKLTLEELTAEIRKKIITNGALQEKQS